MLTGKGQFVDIALLKTTRLALPTLLLCACSCSHIPNKARSLDAIPTAELRTVLKGYAGDWRPGADHSRGLPPPPLQKPHPPDAQLVDLALPETLSIGDKPLADVVNQRRSRRSYSGDALSNEELSFLLWCSQGISHFDPKRENTPAFHLRTVPSAGSRHPFETYLFVNRVEGIEPGPYRFLPLEHKLLPLDTEAGLPHALVDACYGQAVVANAAVVFAWSAIPYRTEWRYGFIAHRMIAIDAGHVCQNLYLAAESIDAGACAMLAYNQQKMDALLGVDGNEEFTFYMATVGKVER